MIDKRVPQWFVLRDLKRANAKEPAFRRLAAEGHEVFTPMVWKIVERRGKRERVEVPYMQDLLFVRATWEALVPIVADTPTLQFRWVRGGYERPMTVDEAEMTRFMTAVTASHTPRYFAPAEVTPAMLGRKVRINGGPLDGLEGCLVTTRGSKVKRLMVEVKGLLAVAVEVNPDYIELIN